MTTGTRAFLAAVLVAFIAASVWLTRQPVQRYEIACNASAAECALTRVQRDVPVRRVVAVDANTVASVRVQPRRRGAPRVLLYLDTKAGSVFAAEFERGDAAGEAQAMAARLREHFRGGSTSSVAYTVAPSPWFQRGMWAGIAVMVGLLVAVLTSRTARANG